MHLPLEQSLSQDFRTTFKIKSNLHISIYQSQLIPYKTFLCKNRPNLCSHVKKDGNFPWTQFKSEIYQFLHTMKLSTIVVMLSVNSTHSFLKLAMNTGLFSKRAFSSCPLQLKDRQVCYNILQIHHSIKSQKHPQ